MPVVISSYALTTLESAKRAVNVTGSSYDDLLTELINAASARIERFCNRNIARRTYTNEDITGNGTRWIVLPNTPVTTLTSLKRVYGAGETEITATIPATSYRLNKDTGVVWLISPSLYSLDRVDFAREFMGYRVTYTAGYSPIPDDIAGLCNELVAETYHALKSDPRRIGESLGDYSYSISVTLAMPEERLASRLAMYRRPLVGSGLSA